MLGRHTSQTSFGDTDEWYQRIPAGSVWAQNCGRGPPIISATWTIVPGTPTPGALRSRRHSWVTCASDFRWPRYADDREEAQLLYVALTRARHVLHADAARRTIERGRPLRELPASPEAANLTDRTAPATRHRSLGTPSRALRAPLLWLSIP